MSLTNIEDKLLNNYHIKQILYEEKRWK
jgi:hypothetical protein